MYTTFFGLCELPFSSANDLRFFYPTPATRYIEASISTALRSDPGLILLTGEPGTGKTTLLRRILGSLEDNARVISLPFSAARFDDVLSYLYEHFAIESRGCDSLTKVVAIQEHLRTLARQGLTTVLCVDEAQNLHKDTLDRLRLLLHLRGPSGKLLQVLLVAQPWLETKLAHPDLCHLQQYVTVHCRVEPLSQDAVRSFIQHRLGAAGCNRLDLFPPESIQRIAYYSQAVPQMINVICDNSLIAAYMARSHTVSLAFVEEVAQNLQLPSDQLLDNKQAQTAAENIQIPVLVHSRQKREQPFTPRWVHNLAWTSIGVFCAWLSSGPQPSALSPFPTLLPSTAEVAPSFAGAPAIVATQTPALPRMNHSRSAGTATSAVLSESSRSSSPQRKKQNPLGLQPPRPSTEDEGTKK